MDNFQDNPSLSSNGSRRGDSLQSSPYLLPGAIILSAVVIAGAVIYSAGGFNGVASGRLPAQAGGAVGAGGSVENLADDDPFLGNPDAKVTVVEFADFQCPFCGRFFKNTEPEIIEKYVKTGKVKFVYRDFAFLGEESQWAAEAAECAEDQDKFWQYHDYLYTHQKGENDGAFTKENLKRFARVLGFNSAAFDRCLDSGKHREEVEKDTADGRQAGVSGTPTVLVNGKSIVGAVPFAQFQTIIDAALAAGK